MDASEPSLRERLADARRGLPGFALSDDILARHVADKAAAAGGARLRVDEIVLACAAAHGDPRAVAHLDAHYLDEIEHVYAQFPRSPTTCDDFRQRIREKLLVGPSPALLGYAGTGALRGWVRSVALHAMLNVTSREGREVATDDAFFDAVLSAEPDAEAAYVKEAHREAFERAFRGAMEALTHRERALLRYAYADGVSIDRIGAVYRVHRATAARWVASARGRLVAATRAELVITLGISDDEAASVIRGALSRVGATLLRSMLAPTSA